MKLYFEKCQPEGAQLVEFFKTMCVRACVVSLDRVITLLGEHPERYFHCQKKSLGSKQLVQAVKTLDKLLYFIHGHVINPKTKMLCSYTQRDADKKFPFLSTYLKEYAKPDQFGCTVLDNLHAQCLSYSGALFNSYLLRVSIENKDQEELTELIYLFNTMQYLVSQLRYSPYQESAEKAFNIWTRLFATIEKEQKQLNDEKKKQQNM